MSLLATETPYPGMIPPPPGVAANVIDPVNEKSGAIIAALVIMITVPSVLMSLRLYVKLCLLKEFRFSDVLGVFAWLVIIAMCGIAVRLLKDGIGLHAWNVTLEGFSTFAHLLNTHQVVWAAGILSSKLAILLQLSDIFVIPGQRNMRWWLIRALVFLNVCFVGSLFFIILFECNPREKIWEPTLPGTCISEQNVFVSSGVINVLDDFIMLILPVVWVSQLHMKNSRKIAIASVFAVGLFACITSIVRLVVSVQVWDTTDTTYTVLPVALWAIAEIASAVSVFALPILPRLFQRPEPTSLMAADDHADITFSSTDTHLSRKSYVEMYDVEVYANRMPYNQGGREGKDTKQMHSMDESSGQQIIRTVTVDQSSGST